MSELLSPRDAGHILGITTSGVIKLARRGGLPELRDSSGRRFFMREVVERAALERKALNKKRDIKCAHCGCIVATVRLNARYCSSRCCGLHRRGQARYSV